MSFTPAQKAIRAFDFDDYGMDEVDPKSEYAEWVPSLAAKVEKAVREQIAADIKAFAKEAAKTDDPAAILGLITAASIATGKPYGSIDELADALDATLAGGTQ